MEKVTYRSTEFILIDKTPFSSLYYSSDLKMSLCIAEAEYIPIDNFKDVFLSVSRLIEKFPMTYFLFDKRALRTFHQPSMEWYFSVWKHEVKSRGLIYHFKILPGLEWFVQAVKAGKHEILKKYGDRLLEGIHITYVNSVESAIEQVNLM